MVSREAVGKDWVEKQLKKYSVNFDEADKDRNGSLRFREIVQSLVKGGFRGSYWDAKKIFTELDKNADKAVSKTEFLKLMKAVPLNDHKEMAMRREFKLIDVNNSGQLTRKEVLDAISNAELNPEADDISNLLIALVKDDDQKLNYEEFLQAWCSRTKK